MQTLCVGRALLAGLRWKIVNKIYAKTSKSFAKTTNNVVKAIVIFAEFLVVFASILFTIVHLNPTYKGTLMAVQAQARQALDLHLEMLYTA